MKKFLAAILFVAAILFIPTRTSAAVVIDTNSWTTKSFNTEIDISRDNVATITEEIKFDFGVSPGHGIKRYIPLTTKVDPGGYHNYGFKLLDVSLDGGTVKYKNQRDNYYQYIKIGDPNLLIQGEHIYQIKYEISPVVEQDTEGDYLSWNVIGDKWDQPIELAKSTIKFARDAQILQTRCYTGATGSVEQACSITPAGSSLSIVATRPLGVNEGMTVNILTAQGGFSNYLTKSNLPYIDWRKYVGFIVGFLLILAALIYKILAYLSEKSQKNSRTIIAEYEPPEDLRPAELGHLEDKVATQVELSATLIDLAVRKYIKIEQISPKSFLKKAKYQFEILKRADANINNYEKDLFNLLDSHASDVEGKKIVKLKDIPATASAPVISKFYIQIMQNLQDKDLYQKTKKNKKRTIFLILAIFLAGVIFGFVHWEGFWPIAVAAALSAALIIRTKLTKKGYGTWAKNEGFKLFLSVTEKDRMAFHDAPAKNPQQFSQFLPYAIALGVEKQWAKQFESMNLQNDIYWYSGSTPNLNAAFLASSLSSDFSGAVNTSIAPSSSGGGFSGGGSAGGGGGGGGGGGW